MHTYSIDAKHRLLIDGKPADFKQTPNHAGTMTPAYLVMHYTASVSFSGAVSWLLNPAAKASAHLVIDYDGKIMQLAPFNTVCWHAGVSKWKGIIGMNSHSIGIEHVNAGIVGQDANGHYFDRLTHRPIDASQVSAPMVHKNGGPACHWNLYPPAQLEASIGIAHAIVDKYGLKDIIGHDDIAPGRKSDPGPAFPMSSIRSKVYGRQ